MNVSVAAQIVIRHISGAKANQIELLPLGGPAEITIGRDSASAIAFTAPGDDIVSRRHAVIIILQDDPATFKIKDLGSGNGTFLNGDKITGEAELLPEDTVELGKGGPKFIFDVQPRPLRMQARTRVLEAVPSNATRIMHASDSAGLAALSENERVSGAGEAAQKSAEIPKSGVGKTTVLHMLRQERHAVNRSWMSAVAGLAVFVALGGGYFAWKYSQDKQSEDLRFDHPDPKIVDNINNINRIQNNIQQKFGMTPQEIVSKFGDSTVFVEVRWRLYDMQTGKPIFQKVEKHNNQEYPVFVRLPYNLGVVRWLTLDDDNRNNIPIGENATGSGFVVGEQGFILTNRHVAAAWSLPYSDNYSAHFGTNEGILYNFRGGPGVVYDIANVEAVLKKGRNSSGKRLTREEMEDLKKQEADLEQLAKGEIIDLTDSDYDNLSNNWTPGSGIIFDPSVALLIGRPQKVDPSPDTERSFEGRNDDLEVRFPGGRLKIAARLLKNSNEADAALIKVDTPQDLKKLDLGLENPKPGEDVIVLGYPGAGVQEFAQSNADVGGHSQELRDYVPEPYVTSGFISQVTPTVTNQNGVTLKGQYGDLFQLGINTTGPGNSGGPVFNKDGKVIGIFTYGLKRGGVNTSAAIPIKYGLDLLQIQR
jgi:serine protease Do